MLGLVTHKEIEKVCDFLTPEATQALIKEVDGANTTPAHTRRIYPGLLICPLIFRMSAASCRVVFSFFCPANNDGKINFSEWLSAMTELDLKAAGAGTPAGVASNRKSKLNAVQEAN